MAEYSLAQRLLRAANNAVVQGTEDVNAFDSIVSATRRNFRRVDVLSPSPRGRKKKDTFRRKVFLTKLARVDFMPGKTEQKYLKNRGLGEADQLLVINRYSTIDVIKENILTLYPNQIQSLLRMSGYRLAKCDKIKKITYMEDITNAADLERLLGASKIIVVPNNDFPTDLPVLNDTPANQNDRSSQSTLHPPSPLVALSPTCSGLYDDFHFEDQTTIGRSISRRPTFPQDEDSEMFNLYSDETIVDKILNVTFKNELGVDGGGLTKELFNVFFQNIEGLYFRGEDCLVPYLELNKMKEKDKFIIIGRIIQHMLLLTGSIPTKLSKVTLMLLAYPEKDIDENILLEELFAYVNPYLRRILKKTVADFTTLKSRETDIIIDFFQSHRFFELPKSDNIKEQLCTIATEILVETLKRLIDALRKGILLDKYDFWAKCDFVTLLEMQKPTRAKVTNCIVTDENLTNDESRILHYLNMYIGCLSNENVGLFVFMITGSFMMPYSISVKFNDLIGLAQRPVFSTCANTLYLPRSYSTYEDLKNDLNACLQSEEAKVYSTY